MTEGDYHINPNDVIEIKIEDAPELSGSFQVGSSGFIPMPFLGSINVLKKTPDEVATFIADGLRGRYLKDPRVIISVAQISQRSFFIQGAVRAPGVYQMEGKPNLLRLITIAGGLADNHGSTAFIIREIKNNGADAGKQPSVPPANNNAPPPPENKTNAANPASEEIPKYEMIKAHINGLLRGNFEQNILIEPGDIVHIPVTDVFFIAGEVRAPGSYPLKEGTTLRQAISLAQGTKFNAAAKKTVLFREEPGTGKRTEIKVDISAVMSGKKEDIPLLANDIIVVPNSRAKSIGGTILSVFGTSMITRLPGL